MLIEDLRGKRVAIWGLGTEGSAMLSYLKKHQITDDVIAFNDDNVPNLSEVDIIIKSPGVSLYRDEIVRFRDKVTSMSDLFLNEIRKKKPECKVVGISGSKGKSTSVSALAFMLNGLGYKTGLGGNIGKPLIELLDDDYDYIVAEFSSYQAADLTISPEIAMFTNLFYVHTEWHRGHENYCKDKIHLIANQKDGDVFFVNERNQQSVDYTEKFSARRELYNNEAGFHAEGKDFYYRHERLFGINDLNLNGNHNLDNLAGVFSILKVLGADIRKAIEILKDFEPLPHRLQRVAVKDGVLFINDSISTAPEAAISGANSFEGNIVLISGGINNDQDYVPYAKNVESNHNIKMVLTVFQNGAVIFDVLKKVVMRDDVVLDNVAGLEEAVKTAFEYLKAGCGGTVLFSPTSPSFDAYKNFMERGNHFINIVESL